MRLLTRWLFRRFTLLGRLADLVMVAGWALRWARRRGMVDDATLTRWGLGRLTRDELTSASGAPETALAGGAALRMARRFLQRRRSRGLL